MIDLDGYHANSPHAAHDICVRAGIKDPMFSHRLGVNQALKELAPLLEIARAAKAFVEARAALQDARLNGREDAVEFSDRDCAMEYLDEIVGKYLLPRAQADEEQS